MKIPLVRPLLVLVSSHLLLQVQSFSSPEEANLDLSQYLQHDVDYERWLQPSIPGCNLTLGIVKAEQVKQIGEIFLDTLVDDPQVSADILYQTSKYDFRVMKLCSSCLFTGVFYSELNEPLPYDWLTYCSNTTYGFRKFQSFLVFIPIQPGTENEIVYGTQLRPYLSFHESRPESNSAPTESWPSNLTATLENVQSGALPASTFRASTFQQFIPSMLAAASGSIALMPDYHGYGTTSELNRTIFWDQGYRQAGITGWIHLRQFLYRYAAPCTQLDLSAVTLHGFEDGAFGAVRVAQAFRRFKTKVLRVFSGTGVFDLDQLIRSAVVTAGEGGTVHGRVKEMLRQAAYTLSFGHPNLSNTGKGQDMVSELFRTSVDQEFSNSATTSTSRAFDMSVATSSTELEFLNPTLVELYATMIANDIVRPCAQDLTTAYGGLYSTSLNALCQAIQEASAYPTLLGETQYNWIHNLEVCYSQDDPVVDKSQVESVDLANNAPGTYVYTKPFGETGDTLAPLGDKHSRVKNICGVSAGLFFVLQNHRPDEVRNWPQYMTPLDYDTAEQCGVLTDSPTTAPNAPTTPTTGTKPTIEITPTTEQNDPTDGTDPPMSTPTESPNADNPPSAGTTATTMGRFAVGWAIVTSALGVALATSSISSYV